MANLDEYIFGYYRCTASSEEKCKLVNALLKLDICSRVSPNGEFILHRRDKEKFAEYASRRMRVTFSRPLGMYGFLVAAGRRYGALLALFIAIIFYVFSHGRVWDVRISGNELITDYEVEKTLEQLGLSVGVRWKQIDKNKIEAELLSENPEIAWISLNRRGTVVYVQVVESENIWQSSESPIPYCNIVADRDGVIEEITVNSGVAVVKRGDVVRAGDVLISGIVEGERGVSFCRASGTVIANGVVNVSAETTSEITDRVAKSRKLAHVRLKIFNFSINIFKNYRNCENTCDIIEENRRIALFGKYRLPIRIHKTYVVNYVEESRVRSLDEMASEAKRELDSKIYSMFKDADVIKLRTSNEFSEDAYRITARVVYATDIGKESAIKIN